jgi:uncharacterized BrkB/YihY/UPF0761 family membrane protein
VSNPTEDPSPAPAGGRDKRLRTWVRTRQERLDAARTTSPTVDAAFDALSYDSDTGAAVLAAALAFRVFLFQVPYACTFVIGAAIVSDITGRDVSSFFQGRGIAGLTATAVASAASLSGWARFTALVVVIYGLFLAARSLVKVLHIVHALVWNVPRHRVASATRAATAFLTLFTLLFFASLAIVQLREQQALGALVLLVLYTAVPFGMWWYVSYRLPHPRCPLIALAPGAALFAVGVELLHLVTVIWFPHLLESKSDVYGTVGMALAMLFWAYLLGRLITLAAVLNAALWARAERGDRNPYAVARPSVHLPLVDDRFDRVWTALFGGGPIIPPE